MPYIFSKALQFILNGTLVKVLPFCTCFFDVMLFWQSKRYSETLNIRSFENRSTLTKLRLGCHNLNSEIKNWFSMDQICKQSSENAKSMKRIEGIHFTVERFQKLKIVKWQMTKLTASSKTILYSPRILLGRSGNSVPLYFYILKSLLFPAFL